jgi:hypothetical protein
MKVSQAIGVAQEWVGTHGSQMPGFCGAYLTGALSTLPENVDLAAYRDVDISVVLSGGEAQGRPILNTRYQGATLEVSFSGLERKTSPESILSSTGAYHLAAGRILADPTGLLQKTHRIVREEYPRRRWVRARRDSAMEKAEQSLESLSRSEGSDGLEHLLATVLYLSNMVAHACLVPPTIRRALVVTKQCLSEWHSLDLHEEALHVLGCDHMDPPRVRLHLWESLRAFERAVEVLRTTTPLSASYLRPHLRPYLLEGAQEMIGDGNHREAMFWILLYHAVSYHTLQIDTLSAERAQHKDVYDRLWATLGHGDGKSSKRLTARAGQLFERSCSATDEIIASHPDITD